ncbi:MAG: flagellar basal body-associated FliL family protein [Novosphingobium sp.]|nr:flagellar basal body-associated FliL family protein [Novosphingobium sp.]
MSKDNKKTEAAPKKGGKGMMVKALAALGLLGAGGGGVFGAMQAGLIGSHGEEKEDNSPKLIRKGEEDPFAPPSSEKEGAGEANVYGDGGSEYRTVYYSFAEDFTSNLKNSDGLVQISLAASTQRDGRVLIWLKKHELAIRSAILTTLADTPEADIYSVDGKTRLQTRLTKAINTELTKREGFGGVDAVYFRSFIVQ